MSGALHRFIRFRPHLTAGLLLGVAAGLMLPSTWSLETRFLSAWDIGVWTYLAGMTWMMARADHSAVRRLAVQQDEKGAVIVAALSLAAIASLAAIVSELGNIKALHDSPQGVHYTFVLATLLGSWLLPGVLFCSHYAHLYYKANAKLRPLAFPDDIEPDYWDFLYFSFTIAVAAQTSDVSVRSRGARRVVLGQSVLSFFFNLVILGMFVNIAAGLINT